MVKPKYSEDVHDNNKDCWAYCIKEDTVGKDIPPKVFIIIER